MRETAREITYTVEYRVRKNTQTKIFFPLLKLYLSVKSVQKNEIIKKKELEREAMEKNEEGWSARTSSRLRLSTTRAALCAHIFKDQIFIQRGRERERESERERERELAREREKKRERE